MAIAADSQIHTTKNARHLDRVCSCERSFQNRLGNFKTDEVVISFGRVVSLGCLVHIEAKLHLRVRGGLILIGNDRSVFPCQFGIHHSNCTIGRNWMTGSVSSIVRECTERKGVFVQISGFFNQRKNKIPTPDIVR